MVKPNQQGQPQQNNMMMSGPRMGLKPYNPRTSDYTHTTPNGMTQTVTRGGMPNFENIGESGRKVGLANFMDAIMPAMATNKLSLAQNPVNALRSRMMMANNRG